jgi:DNA polymerase III, beta subunit (EC 2.7.7.7)
MVCFFELNKDSLTVVATDGHRLSIGEVKQNNDLEERKTVILPRKAVLELTKLLNKKHTRHCRNTFVG